jgi:hypothetical protein
MNKMVGIKLKTLVARYRKTLFIVITILLVVLAYVYGYDRGKLADTTQRARAQAIVVTESGVEFNGSIPAAKRTEIIRKITDPMTAYYKDVLKDPQPLHITVKLGTSPDAKLYPNKDWGYVLGYGSTGEGFTFGEDGMIDYWRPALCDEGSCQPYPEGFRRAFPDTYARYMIVDYCAEQQFKPCP